MKIMLTSFGVEHSLSSEAGQESMFHRMPPVSFGRISERFMPDYELLLLCDNVIMDEVSFDRLIGGSVAAYSEVSETFSALKSEGRIELKNFSSILRPHTEFLSRIIDHDLKSLDQWVVPLRESLTLWRHFSKMSMDIVEEDRKEWLRQPVYRDGFSYLTRQAQAALFDGISHTIHHDKNIAGRMSMLVNEALESSEKRKRKEFRGALRDVLRAYLTYVDANLILSNQMDCGFHDWLDFTPFYAAKFLSVGHADDPVREGRAQLEKLFTVPFPDLAISNTHSLMKALSDKRLEDLRLLVAEAVAGNVEFDDEFAKSVLREVFHGSERAKKWRNVVGYATLPIGFIPWVGTAIQKAVEEGFGIPIERKFKQKHRWFYMLSDIAEAGGKAEQ